MWHLPLLTFVFCGFSSTAAGKVKSQLFYIAQSAAALIYTTGWDGNHLQDASEEMFAWEHRYHIYMVRVQERVRISISVRRCFVARTLLHMYTMGPKPLKHRGWWRLHKQVGSDTCTRTSNNEDYFSTPTTTGMFWPIWQAVILSIVPTVLLHRHKWYEQKLFV